MKYMGDKKTELCSTYKPDIICNKERRIIIAISVLFSVISILLFNLSKNNPIEPDTPGYIYLSKNLFSPASWEFIDLLRPIGYPIFLFILGNDINLIVIVQHLLIIIFLFVVERIAYEVYQDRRKSFIATILCMTPLMYIFPNIVMSETLFLILLVLFIYFFTVFLRTDEDKDIVKSAFSLALATYIRPITQFMPIMLFLLVLFDKKLVKKIVLFSVVFYLLLSPWTIKNYIVANTIMMSNLGPLGVVYYAADTYGAQHGEYDHEKATTMYFDELNRRFNTSIIGFYTEITQDNPNIIGSNNTIIGISINRPELFKDIYGYSISTISSGFGTFIRLHISSIVGAIIAAQHFAIYNLSKGLMASCKYIRISELIIKFATTSCYLYNAFVNIFSSFISFVLVVTGILGFIKTANKSFKKTVFFAICFFYLSNMPSTTSYARFAFTYNWMFSLFAAGLIKAKTPKA